MSSLMAVGMHGLGDNIYSRAVIRQYLKKFDHVWLETPWPQVFHDMPSRLHLTESHTHLRTQLKNISRSQGLYENAPDVVDEIRRITYFSSEIRSGKWDSLPNAMLGAMGCDIPGDYRLPVPIEWQDEAKRMIGFQEKPILIYRPLTFRQEWRASATRNPDTKVFVEIFNEIRQKFFVVSIADVDQHNEIVVSPQANYDLAFHNGQFTVERLLGLFKIAKCVFSCPGFALAMAQAVQTPSIIVFGGHESSKTYRSSATFAPILMIDPVKPCDCFDNGHRCEKLIDIDKAKSEVVQWTSNLLQ